jgi:hypothetical protein
LSKSQHHQKRNFKFPQSLHSPGDSNPCRALVKAGVCLSFGLFWRLKTAATGSIDKKNFCHNYICLRAAASPKSGYLFTLALFGKKVVLLEIGLGNNRLPQFLKIYERFWQSK